MSTAALAAPDRAAVASQRENALGLANLIRSRRAIVKRQLHMARSPGASLQLAAEVISSPDAALEGMPIGPLLLACRGMGASKLQRLLRAAAVSEISKVGTLTAGQRHQLIGALRMAAA